MLSTLAAGAYTLAVLALALAALVRVVKLHGERIEVRRLFEYRRIALMFGAAGILYAPVNTPAAGWITAVVLAVAAGYVIAGNRLADKLAVDRTAVGARR